MREVLLMINSAKSHIGEKTPRSVGNVGVRKDLWRETGRPELSAEANRACVSGNSLRGKSNETGKGLEAETSLAGRRTKRRPAWPESKEPGMGSWEGGDEQTLRDLREQPTEFRFSSVLNRNPPQGPNRATPTSGFLWRKASSVGLRRQV